MDITTILIIVLLLFCWAAAVFTVAAAGTRSRKGLFCSFAWTRVSRSPAG